jgi:ammonia channel protein AmtB
VCYGAGLYFNERTGIDDSLDVFTVHGLGGSRVSVGVSVHVNED